MSDYLMKCLWKGVADTEQQQDAAAHIEELEGKLVWAMEYVADYSSDPHLVEWANVNLAAVSKTHKLKGQADE